jgi:hypothetical protein
MNNKALISSNSSTSKLGTSNSSTVVLNLPAKVGHPLPSPRSSITSPTPNASDIRTSSRYSLPTRSPQVSQQLDALAVSLDACAEPAQLSMLKTFRQVAAVQANDTTGITLRSLDALLTEHATLLLGVTEAVTPQSSLEPTSVPRPRAMPLMLRTHLERVEFSKELKALVQIVKNDLLAALETEDGICVCCGATREENHRYLPEQGRTLCGVLSSILNLLEHAQLDFYRR